MYTIGNLQHFLHTALPLDSAHVLPVDCHANHFLTGGQFSNKEAVALREYIAYLGNTMLALPHVAGRVQLSDNDMAMRKVRSVAGGITILYHCCTSYMIHKCKLQFVGKHVA
jgi:hypothetical protein